MSTLSIVTSEIVINTESVQYRVTENGIDAMLLSGHKFTVTLEQLIKLQAALQLLQK